MRLHLTADEADFREGMRTFFTTEVPQSTRDLVLSGEFPGKEAYVESQRILNAAGLQMGQATRNIVLDPSKAEA